MSYSGHQDQRFGHISYAQHGDDFMILNLFDLMGIKSPSYLDIGAHHPTTISNTALLYARGSRGINVEANPNLIEAFRRERPEDVNLNIGVAEIQGLLPFYMHGPTAGRNTFDPKERDQLIAEGHSVQETRMIKMTTINQIVLDHGSWPDLLSMDIEGFDCQVLGSAEFWVDGENVGPKVICVEIRRTPDAELIKQFLKFRGYTFLCRMIENLFFVRDDFVKFIT